jgi:hypothetical protein
MKLRLVIDNDSSTTQAWYRLEEWEPIPIRSMADAAESGRWSLVASGYEPEVRRVYERLRAAGEHKTLVEEFDSEGPWGLASAEPTAQTTDSSQPPLQETEK